MDATESEFIGKGGSAGVTKRHQSWTLPLGVTGILLIGWYAVAKTGWFHPSALPDPVAVWNGFAEEIRTGRLFRDIIISLYRVLMGFFIAVVTGLPIGVWLGEYVAPRQAFLPAINFFRNLSPLAWIPFAILWFGVGDAASVFLIFLAAFFPVVVAAMAAVASIPNVYYRVAQNYGVTGFDRLTHVTLPAIMPEIITALRMTAGLCWLVDVAAEMIAGRDGLGFAVMDSRNGLRTDLLVVEMIAIGLIGVALDRILRQLTQIPSVRWGYER